MATRRTNPTQLRGKFLSQVYFTPKSPGSYVYTCVCGVERTQKGSGYTNLISHIKSNHPEHVERVPNGPNKNNIIMDMLVPQSVRNLFGWLTWICTSLLPISFCDNTMTRAYSSLAPICTNTFMKYLLRMTAFVERKIGRCLPEQFALVFDGWSCGSTHYVVVFATFPAQNSLGYDKVLLSFPRWTLKTH